MNEVSAQDYVEILNLYARYNLCSDAGDGDGYADTFSSDGHLDVVTPGPTMSSERPGELRGVQAKGSSWAHASVPSPLERQHPSREGGRSDRDRALLLPCL